MIAAPIYPLSSCSLNQAMTQSHVPCHDIIWTMSHWAWSMFDPRSHSLVGQVLIELNVVASRPFWHIVQTIWRYAPLALFVPSAVWLMMIWLLLCKVGSLMDWTDRLMVQQMRHDEMILWSVELLLTWEMNQQQAAHLVSRARHPFTRKREWSKEHITTLTILQIS